MAANLYTHQSSNITRTWLLMGAFLILVIFIGWILSYAFNDIAILYIAIVFSLGMNVFAYWNSDKIALRQARAVPADQAQYLELHRLIENLAITAGLPKPRVYIIPDQSLNAFATGRDPEHAAIAVTAGLLQHLDRAELEGVIAHEMAHIGNRDILVMSIAVVLAGFITLIADMFLRGAIFAGSNDNRGGVQILIVLGTMILSAIFATLLKLAISRRREYLADATGALLTRYPEGLARALEKISAHSRLQTASAATAHLYISSPFGTSKRVFGELFATHPPVEKRLAALRGLEI